MSHRFPNDMKPNGNGLGHLDNILIKVVLEPFTQSSQFFVSLWGDHVGFVSSPGTLNGPITKEKLDGHDFFQLVKVGKRFNYHPSFTDLEFFTSPK